jgi:hypothetical protein
VTRLLWVLPLLLVGCASVVPLGNDRYLRTQSTQDPVLFGVSNSHAMAQDCKGTQREGYLYEKLDFSDCLTVRIDHGSAPGYGTALANALIQGLTLGLVANYIGGDGGATASATATSTAISKGKGH